MDGFRPGLTWVPTWLRGAACAAVAAILTATTALAAGGHVVNLTASDAPNPGDSTTVSSTVQADGKVNSSNLYYEITAPDGTLVSSHQTDLPNMRAGDTYSDSWSTDNSAFPTQGTYTVTLCWSTGNSHNCDIASKGTTFYSVPTMGWTLGLIALALLLVFLWRQRSVFAEASA